MNYGNLMPGQTTELVFRATIDNMLPIGTTITNTATVYWNAASQNASATVSIDVGGVPGVEPYLDIGGDDARIPRCKALGRGHAFGA